jgi:hypothetical protein
VENNSERLAALEAVLYGKGQRDGVLARLDHLHACVESLKVTVWKAVGAGAGAMVVAELVMKWFGAR